MSSRIVLLLLAAAAHAGCVYVSTRVPAEWERAMSRPAPSIAGTYRALGERTFKEGGGRIGGGHLAEVFNDVTADPGFCPLADTIRVRPLGRDQLEIVAMNGDKAVATKTLPADIGTKITLDGVKVERPMNKPNRRISGLKIRNDAVLMKGADGYLYVREKHRATATLGGVVPFGGGGESWLRFPPAT